MLDELGPEFKLQLFQAILTVLTCYYNPPQTIERHISTKLGWTITDPFEVVELIEWIKFLFKDVLQYDHHNGKSRNEILSLLVDDLNCLYELVPQEKDIQSCFLKVLTSLQESYETKAMKNVIKSETKTRINDWITTINTTIDIRASYDLPPSLDELLGDTNNSESIEGPKPVLKRQKN
jgi:ribosomal biogenesis protein LAS1